MDLELMLSESWGARDVDTRAPGLEDFHIKYKTGWIEGEVFSRPKFGC